MRISFCCELQRLPSAQCCIPLSRSYFNYTMRIWTRKDLSCFCTTHGRKKECAIGTFSRRGAVALATIYHCAECDNIFYVIGDSIGISYYIKKSLTDFYICQGRVLQIIYHPRYHPVSRNEPCSLRNTYIFPATDVCPTSQNTWFTSYPFWYLTFDCALSGPFDILHLDPASTSPDSLGAHEHRYLRFNGLVR